MSLSLESSIEDFPLRIATLRHSSKPFKPLPITNSVSILSQVVSYDRSTGNCMHPYSMSVRSYRVEWPRRPAS